MNEVLQRSDISVGDRVVAIKYVDSLDMWGMVGTIIFITPNKNRE